MCINDTTKPKGLPSLLFPLLRVSKLREEARKLQKHHTTFSLPKFSLISVTGKQDVQISSQNKLSQSDWRLMAAG